MKGLLIHLSVIPTKTHDLAYLNQLLEPVCSEWSWPSEDLRFLTRAAVAFRYPGQSADREEAQKSLHIATSLREKLLALLNDKL
jgi:HEPN domain-containing protein